MLNKKLYSTVVALSVGMSGCYGSQSGVLRGQDSLLQHADFPTEFQTGFERFYHAGSLEHKILGGIADKTGPCPPYLPNCKKKEEKKNTDEDEVFRESSPYRSSPAAPSSSENPTVSKKGCGMTCVNTGYIVSGVGILLLGAVLTGGNDSTSRKQADSASKVAVVGITALFAGLGLTIYGYATKD